MIESIIVLNNDHLPMPRIVKIYTDDSDEIIRSKGYIEIIEQFGYSPEKDDVISIGRKDENDPHNLNHIYYELYELYGHRLLKRITCDE